MTAYQIGTRPYLTVREALQRVSISGNQRFDDTRQQLCDVLLLGRALGLRTAVSTVQERLGLELGQPFNWDVLRSLQLLEDLDPLFEQLSYKEELAELHNLASFMGCFDADSMLAAALKGEVS